ncbi:hypothetical protein LZ554_004889 [Drepanopeziza brunnea f. sp. 'monogermtubi']|nr:hypothetical protein LZ554_004889 [Drepanopeziza brunnea f. sp. 'monogermtubi']
MLLSLPFISIVISTVTSALPPNHLQRVENLHNAPYPWTSSRIASPDQGLQLSIALQRGAHIEATLYKISTPSHSQYKRHLTREEAQSLLRPDAESHSQIISWLDQHDVTIVSDDSHWIRFNTTVKSANTLLSANFKWYRNAGNGKEVLRTLRYSVPGTLHSKISLISPTTRFCNMKSMQPSAQHQDLRRGIFAPVIGTKLPIRRESKRERPIISPRGTVDPTCNRTVTPDCLRALYNVPTNMTLSSSRGIGVYASQQQIAKFSDFKLFTQNVDPKAMGANFTFLSVNGGIDGVANQNDTIDSDQETNFDVQYSASLSAPIPNVVFSIGGQGPIQPELGNQPGDGTEPWLQWLDAMLALPDAQLPHTITTSFGEDEQSLPDGYVQQVCNQFGALGARGVSMIAASGDSGPGSTCTNNNGSVARFTPIFPGSCPYVTAVGGVKGVGPETAVSFSAGGFSDKFAMPAYQQNAVPAYVAPYAAQFPGMFNATGRGFPDVAAQSFNLTFVEQGKARGFAGTSAASPTWAGLIGMVNSALIAQNKAPLGFLNPWLYSTGLAGMTDITVGRSVGCQGKNPFTGATLPASLGSKLIAGAGWNATTGWDAVTGLGTPDVTKLMALAMSGP